MRKPAARVLYWGALALLCATPSLFASVSMTLTGAGPNNLAGIYIGPYTALIDGVPTQVICDDFSADTYLNQTWSANLSTFSDLSGTKFGAAKETQYKQAAWLSLQLLNPTVSCPPGGNCAADIQFAIWQVFDNPNPFNILQSQGLITDLSNAKDWLAKAQDASNYNSLNLSAFSFYTPTPLNSGSPQEFIVVKTPEASALALLGIDLSAVGGLFLLFRRRSLNRHSTQA